jgi:hypothetical protein
MPLRPVIGWLNRPRWSVKQKKKPVPKELSFLPIRIVGPKKLVLASR